MSCHEPSTIYNNCESNRNKFSEINRNFGTKKINDIATDKSWKSLQKYIYRSFRHIYRLFIEERKSSNCTELIYIHHFTSGTIIRRSGSHNELSTAKWGRLTSARPRRRSVTRHSQLSVWDVARVLGRATVILEILVVRAHDLVAVDALRLEAVAFQWRNPAYAENKACRIIPNCLPRATT